MGQVKKRLRRLSAAATVALLSACATPAKPLYVWESFPKQQYNTLIREGASPDEQIRVLEAQAEKTRGSQSALPPGFRAHLGMLYLGVGNPQRARELWLAEKEAFPESTPYMNRLLERLEGGAASPASPGARS